MFIVGGAGFYPIISKDMNFFIVLIKIFLCPEIPIETTKVFCYNEGVKFFEIFKFLNFGFRKLDLKMYFILFLLFCFYKE